MFRAIIKLYSKVKVLYTKVKVKKKVITLAKAADSAKGSIITTARVWSSIDLAKKVDVGTDGSYTL